MKEDPLLQNRILFAFICLDMPVFFFYETLENDHAGYIRLPEPKKWVYCQKIQSEEKCGFSLSSIFTEYSFI